MGRNLLGIAVPRGSAGHNDDRFVGETLRSDGTLRYAIRDGSPRRFGPTNPASLPRRRIERGDKRGYNKIVKIEAGRTTLTTKVTRSFGGKASTRPTYRRRRTAFASTSNRSPGPRRKTRP